MSKRIALAYVGTVAPDTPEFNQPPFSRSANQFQTGLLQGIGEAGLRPRLILSLRSIQSFPRGRVLWEPGRTLVTERGWEVRFLGFFNLTPLKQVLISLNAAFNLFAWAVKERGAHRIIHLYNLTVPNGILIWVVAKLTSSKIVVSICDVEVPGHTVPNRLIFRIDYWMTRWIIPKLDGRVVVSEAIAEDLAEGKPCLLVEGGIEEASVTEPTKRLAGESAPPSTTNPIFRVAAVGRLDETNGFDVILKMMEVESDPNLILELAGSGPLELEIKAAAARDARIHFHGYVELSKVHELYARADLALVIRRTQDLDTRFFFPGKFMEALASGVPVLATNFGNVKSRFKDCFYLLEDESPEGVKAMVSKIRGHSQKARREQGRSAQNFVLEHFGWKSQGQRVVGYYRQILELIG